MIPPAPFPPPKNSVQPSLFPEAAPAPRGRRPEAPFCSPAASWRSRLRGPAGPSGAVWCASGGSPARPCRPLQLFRGFVVGRVSREAAGRCQLALTKCTFFNPSFNLRSPDFGKYMFPLGLVCLCVMLTWRCSNFKHDSDLFLHCRYVSVNVEILKLEQQTAWNTSGAGHLLFVWIPY